MTPQDIEKIDIYRTIAVTAEASDPHTSMHIERMGEYGRILAKSLGMPSKFADDMSMFAPMHDIGKMGIADSILLAPRSLSDAEFDIMKKHPIIGQNILKKNECMSTAADIAIGHHEWWNGKGYPHGKKKDNIPMSARITALADVYDALRSRRPYKDGWPKEKVGRYIESLCDKQFDPAVVYAFLKVQDKMDEIFLNF